MAMNCDNNRSGYDVLKMIGKKTTVKFVFLSFTLLNF